MAGSQGHFELNVFKPMMSYNVLQSMQLLGDAASAFTDNCDEGIQADESRISRLMWDSLMLVTALAPEIEVRQRDYGCKDGTQKWNDVKGGSHSPWLRRCRYFDRVVQPKDMIGPNLLQSFRRCEIQSTIVHSPAMP